jgi:cytochrome P450
MSMQTIQGPAPASQAEQARCPVDHNKLSQQKTARVEEPVGCPIEQDAQGVWHVRGHEQARQILRSTSTKQAGFRADLLARIPQRMRQPILYQEGKTHLEQRKATARFFTPKAVSENYRQLMEEYADSMIRELLRTRRADLSVLSMKLAVRVAGEVIGLTNSRLPGMDRRLNAFFSDDIVMPGWSPRTLLSFARNQIRVLSFFYLDVKPAIEARRRAPQEDLISHLLAQGYEESEILTECITYGAAGMITTREFITIAAWHLLEQPSLRAEYLHGDDEARQQLLQEILRLEPVVGNLYRRATEKLEIATESGAVTIPRGSLINLHIYAVNADETVAGDHPLLICPRRELRSERVSPAVMSFGDGHHRCPGAYIAIQESDIFLQRLLRLEGLQIEQKPSISWKELIAGYELRNFILSIR